MSRYFLILLCLLSLAWQVPAQDNNDLATTANDCNKASSAYLDGAVDEALILIKRCRQQRPDDLTALILLGKIQHAYGRHALAVDIFQQVFKQGADAQLFARQWARSLIAARQYTTLARFSAFDEFAPAIRIDWLKHRAIACGELNDDSCVTQTYSALESLGETLTAALGFAEQAIDNKNGREAGKQLELAGLIAPNDVRVLLAYARLALSQQQYDLALDYIEKASVISPQDPLVLRTLADIYLAAERQQEAADTLDVILNLTPEDPFAILVRASLDHGDKYTAILAAYKMRIEEIHKASNSDNMTLYYLQGMIAYQSQHYEQALSAFSRLVKSRAFYPQTLALLAKTHVVLNQSDQAITLLEPEQNMLLSEAPDAMALLIELLIEQGKTFKALPIWQSFADRYPERLDTGLLEVKILFGRGKKSEAMEKLSQLRLTFPDSEIVTRVYAVALSYAGDYQQAMTMVNGQLAHASQPSVWYNFKGALHLMLKEQPKAETAFKQALSLDSTLLPAQINLAWMAFQRGGKAQALLQVEHLVTQHPAHFALQQMYAGMLLSDGQVELAKTRYEALYQIDNSQRSVIESLITIYQREENRGKSISLLGRLIELKYDTARNLLRRAQLYIAQNEINRADLDLYKALPLSGDNPRLLMAIANASIQTGNQRQAVNSLQQARQLNPADPLPYIKLSELYLNANQTENAMQAITEAEAFSSLAELWVLKGRLAEQQGQPLLANEHYHHALKINPAFELAFARLYGLTRFNIGKAEFEMVLTAHVKTMPELVFSRSLLGQYYYYERNFQQSALHYEYLFLQAQDDIKKAGYARRLAQLYFHFDPPKAINYVSIAESMNPEDPFILPLKGWAQVQSNNKEAGLTLLREAYKRNDRDVDTQYFLAHTLASMGMTDEARTVLAALTANQGATFYTQEIEFLSTQLSSQPKA